MLFDFITIIFAIVLSIPLLAVEIELLISLFYRPATQQEKDSFKGTYQILMPAHNEAEIIDDTLSLLVKHVDTPSSIIVIADNCSDNTAEKAKKHGVTVLERTHDELRGKGYALDFGIAYLKKKKQPDIVIILDADCEIDANSINNLAIQCFKKQLPTQAIYLMRNNINDSLKQRVAGFAWLVKNKIRPIAVNILGLPVTLTGTGMAFPWHVISSVSLANGNIVEDMQLGIDCALMDAAPVLCNQALVYSDFPEQVEAEKTQRTRWEHGHLMTITQQVPKLIKESLIKKDWRLFGLALDIGVPPLSMLIMFSVIGLFLLAVYSFFSQNFTAFFILFINFLLFVPTLILVWWRFGKDYLTAQELAGIPAYILSKLGVYKSFIFNRQKAWVRTERKK
jgi:cellulose synthase/poly-beta-1,6-N-acetylglucosamine synthase-like glycosyltransferase